MLNKFWKVRVFFSSVLVPLVVLALYFGSFAYFISSVWFLPKSVNYVFASKSWDYLLILVVGSFFIFAFLKYKKGEGLAFNSSIVKISVGDFLLLLLPLTPVAQYIINNQDILSPLESLYVLGYLVIFSGLYVFAIPALLGVVGSTRTLMILGLAFVSTITNMALLSQYFAWFESGDFKIQLMFFAGVFLVIWFFYTLKNKKLMRLIIVVSFIANSTTQLLAQGEGTDSASLQNAENQLLSLIEGRIPAVTPNIYLLVYDAYIPSETMLAHDIDNSSQEEYLKGLGFEIYPHTYSVAAASSATMSRVLDVSSEIIGNDRRGPSGDGIIQNTLRGYGYETYGIFNSDFFFRGIGSSYDYSFPEPSSSTDILLSAILMGEFRFDIVFDNPPRGKFIETKQSIFEGVSGDPVFIYMHSEIPGHSQNSGACLPDETDRFIERLTRANFEMRQDIKTITENDPEAIVIVAGDHGPYLTKNCRNIEEGYDISEISRLDIQDRFGAFLAIRWPTEDFEIYDDIIVLQDLFPAVFAYLFGDERILESKIEPSTIQEIVIGGASVQNGIIYGGINDGEPLFETGQ